VLSKHCINIDHFFQKVIGIFASLFIVMEKYYMNNDILFSELQKRLEAAGSNDPKFDALEAVNFLYCMEEYPMDLMASDPITVILRDILLEEEEFYDWSPSGSVFWNSDKSSAVLHFR